MIDLSPLEAPFWILMLCEGRPLSQINKSAPVSYCPVGVATRLCKLFEGFVLDALNLFMVVISEIHMCQRAVLAFASHV